MRLPDTPLAQEDRLHRYKVPAVQAFARANPIDRRVIGKAGARIGIVSAGKACLDVLQALGLLGIDAALAGELGVSLFKVGLAWPIEPDGIRAFCKGLDRVIFVEEKRGLIEGQVRELLYGSKAAPKIVGKRDDNGQTLFSSSGVLNARDVALALAPYLPASKQVTAATGALADADASRPHARTTITRLPHFCAGCPHNTSTNVPEGSRAISGTGCSYMVQWMDRRTLGYTHMGADGATWIGEAPFSDCRHVFQNMGDGTYHHSGTLAIRAAVAAGVNITYKILFNDAVAMTGGQPHDGTLTVPQIVRQLQAEGVSRVSVVSDEPDKYGTGGLPPGVTARHRDELDAVQRELRQVEGVSALVYDQTCAAEKRRRRKRGTYPDPARRVFINDLVCEGCGDCGEQSNCIAILPLETELGRKRVIDQTACNKDFSCLKGFCPSFVTVEGGSVRKPSGTAALDLPSSLPEPSLPALNTPLSIVLAGVGGTGILTVSALLGTAAHLEGKGCTVLDMTGLAQKGGAVVSHVWIGASPGDMTSARVGFGQCDVLIGCDLVVAVGDQAYSTLSSKRSFAVLNAHQRMVGGFTRDPDLALPQADLLASFTGGLGADRCRIVDADELANAAFGDTMMSNILMLGVAYQLGHVPLSEAAIMRAMELNGVAIDANKAAFTLGRHYAVDPDRLAAMQAGDQSAGGTMSETLDELISRREAFLVAYQDRQYAARYRRLVDQVRSAEDKIAPGANPLAGAVAKSYFKLLAYKDEYEVARLYTDGSFMEKVKAQFEGAYSLHVHLAPPLVARRHPSTGHLQKSRFGPWMFGAFALLARFKGLRGTAFDPFGRTAERRMERKLIGDYEQLIGELLSRLSQDRLAAAAALAALPLKVRGFGHVKLRSVELAQAEKAELLKLFRGDAPARMAAE